MNITVFLQRKRMLGNAFRLNVPCVSFLKCNIPAVFMFRNAILPIIQAIRLHDYVTPHHTTRGLWFAA